MDKMRTLVKWVNNLSSNNFSGGQSTAKMAMALHPQLEFKAAVIANKVIGHKRELNLLNKVLLMQKVEALQRDNALKEQALQSAAMETMNTPMVRVEVLADELCVVAEGQEKMALTLLQVEEKLNADLCAKEPMDQGKASIPMNFGVVLQQLEALHTATALKEQELQTAAMETMKTQTARVEVLADELSVVAEGQEKMNFTLFQVEEELNAPLSAKEAMDRGKESVPMNFGVVLQQLEALQTDTALKEQELQTAAMETIKALEDEVEHVIGDLFRERQANDHLSASLLQALEKLDTILPAVEAMERQNASLLLENDRLTQQMEVLRRDAALKEQESQTT